MTTYAHISLESLKELEQSLDRAIKLIEDVQTHLNYRINNPECIQEKIEIAEKLLAEGKITTPKQYMDLLK